MFRAAIFAMDGLLIDSEPIWKLTEREVFGARHRDQRCHVGGDRTDDDPSGCRTLVWHPPLAGQVRPGHGSRRRRPLADLIRAGSTAMPGVREVLALCAQLGWRVGLASNSPAVLCQLVLRELGIAHALQAVASADLVEHGKPDPAVYL